MGPRRVEGVEPAPQKPSSRRVASRAWRPAPTPSSRPVASERKNTGAKRQMSKNGGRGTGFTGKISAKCCQRARRLRARRAGGSGTTGGGSSTGSSAPPGKRSGFPWVDGRKIVEDGAETAQGHRRAGVDDLASQHLSGSIVAARAEAKLRSKNKNASTRPWGAGARGNCTVMTGRVVANSDAPRGVRSAGHGRANQ